LPESSLVVLASGSGLAGTGRFLFGVVFISSQIYLSSANTGLLGGLVVVAGGGLLVALAGYLDWLRPRIGEHSGVEG
jgi:hypothetical protein